MRTFMDEVAYDATGNQVTMIKRREDPARAATAPASEAGSVVVE
jgi:hypothetical protein